MTLDEIDKQLAAWEEQISQATTNLLEVEGLISVQWLKGVPGKTAPAALTGLSKTKVPPALAALGHVWTSMKLLTDVLEEAKRLRHTCKGGIFARDGATIKQIEELLTGPSVKLPPKERSLADRELFASATEEQATTPAAVLKQMTDSFHEAKAVLLAIDKAITSLMPGLQECEAEIGKLEASATTISASALTELTSAKGKIADLRKMVLSDPLSALAVFDREVKPIIHNMDARLKQLQEDQVKAKAEMSRARSELASIKFGQPKDTQRVGELERWLDSLESTMQQGEYDRVLAGLSNWFKNASAMANGAATSGPTKDSPPTQAAPSAATAPQDSPFYQLLDELDKLLNTPAQPIKPSSPAVSSSTKPASANPSLEKLIESKPASVEKPKSTASDAALDGLLKKPEPAAPTEGNKDKLDALLGNSDSPKKPVGSASETTASAKSKEQAKGNGKLDALIDGDGAPGAKKKGESTTQSSAPSDAQPGKTIDDLF